MHHIFKINLNASQTMHLKCEHDNCSTNFTVLKIKHDNLNENVPYVLGYLNTFGPLLRHCLGRSRKCDLIVGSAPLKLGLAV